MNTELIAKAKEAKSPEELMALAKARSMTCSWSPCSTRTESPDTPYKNFSPGPLVSSCIPGRDVIR